MYFTHPQLKFNWKNIKKIAWAFLKPKNEKAVKNQLTHYLANRDFIFCDMARTAFKIIIEKFGLQNTEILIPAYICDIFLPIFQEYNIKPIFLDIDLATFNINIEQLKNKITPQTKALILCHTYGLPCALKKIQEITENKILLIEDFSHGFGTVFNSKHLGSFGDASFCSLYKQFPSVRGGLLVLHKTNEAQKIESELEKTRFSLRDAGSLLNYFPFFSFLFKKFAKDIAPKIVRQEKNKKPSAINRVSLNLFELFLKDFEKEFWQRKKAAMILQRELEKFGFQFQETNGNVFCYLSCLCPESINRDNLVLNLRKKGVSLTRIWHTPIILNPETQKTYNINLQEFPNTVEASKRIINIPLQNWFGKKEINKIVKTMKEQIA